LKLKATVLDPKGVECLMQIGELRGDRLTIEDAEGLGKEIAEALLSQGADELIRKCRSESD
jgi:hypothetical protein